MESPGHPRPDALSLEGKVAVVTGGSKGIGRSVALALAGRGADVIVAARHGQELRRVAGEVEGLGRRARAVCLDVGSRAEVDEFMSSAVPEFGGIDIYVNNAGVTVFKHLLETTPEEVERILDTNLKGAINGVTGAARQMIQQGRGGVIVFVTSINALWPLPKQAIYSASKAALEALVRCLAADLARDRIRVN